MKVFISLSALGLSVINLADSIIDVPKSVTIKTIIIMEVVFGISSIMSVIYVWFICSGLEVQKGAWILMLGNTNTSGAIVRNVLDLSTTAFPYSYTQTFCAAHIIDVTNYSNCVITNSGRVNDVLVFGYDSSGRYLECQYKFTDGGATHNIDVSGYDSVLLVQGMRSSTYSSCTLTLS